MEGATIGMMNAITQGVSTVISAAGDVITAIVTDAGEMSALLPVIGMAIGLGLVGWAIRTIKSLTWGF